ncbi:heparinase [Niabella ginsenosidivorans]|uniref:Heparinase n=1 Tax=Niabella ginsenosidivorans TaxID=1176587 RepID=A0A1A9HZI5_9BACT|nr:heparin-sulfate lyase HepC [Niabella ginsenosidivorans]ANH80495.1 heparinase [Niabella ginsenosidivorans]
MRCTQYTGLSILFIGIAFLLKAQQTPISQKDFDIINLNYPGLEKVKTAVAAHQYDKAATALLTYFKKKSADREPDFSASEENVSMDQPVDKATKATADSALLHKFQPHKGYGFFDYGKDINWQLWPVKDNEVRWQLHRVKWWQSMALVYRATHNERYATEWMAQFSDWVAKNPPGLSADNDKYAWRPLEVSDRILNLAPAFSIFVSSPHFTPAFLMRFLKSYHQQADYLSTHYADKGNHRLFEAQRVLFAGTSFPEFKNAPAWRKSGIEILNTEIKKQVYPDGVQWELSPNYHVAMINTFLSALRSARAAGLEREFSAGYRETVEKMILATINYSFPDYTYPMFGDAKLVDKKSMLKAYNSWAKAFPDNAIIQFFASQGSKGKQPPYLSHGLATSGFYTFRNGWKEDATVLVLKASPPGAFHAQPDNGTFNLWIKGRNFTPDAGCYVYAGDSTIMKLRNWYRQTRVHSTLTLDNANMVITQAQQQQWKTGKGLDILTYTNPSYPKLKHQRSVLFIDQKYFLMIDRAIGKATGNIGVHFQLKEDSKAVFDQHYHKVHTTYADGNNLLIQSLNKDQVSLKEEEGKVSYAYRREVSRPAFVFEKPKTDGHPQTFVTILYPYSGEKVPEISLKENAGNNYDTNSLHLTLTINGRQKELVMKLAD